MSRGSKSGYTSKQKRQVGHIEQSELKRGKSKKAAEKIGWATINKKTGGALKNKRNKIK